MTEADGIQLPASPPDPGVRAAGESLIRIGGWLAAAGFIASLIALLPLVISELPSWPWLWFVAIGGVSIGVGMVLWGILRSARARGAYLHSASRSSQQP